MEENLTEGIVEQMEKRHGAERTLNELAAVKQKALKKQLAEKEEQLAKKHEQLAKKHEQLNETKRQLNEAQAEIKKLMEKLKRKK